MRRKISVVIPVFNVESIIQRCLDALQWADEVNIIDMYSSDETPQICLGYPNVRFFQNRGYIYSNVNFGIVKSTHSWIMRLDSDEVVTPELAHEILEVVLTEKYPEYNGFYGPLRTFYFGKWVKYGPAFDPRSPVPGETYRKLIFRKGTAYYRCEREHEDLTSSGKYGFLRSHYLHYSHESISQWLGKMNYYTDRDVERVPLEQISVNSPLKLPYWLLRNFCHLYIRKHGYRDGYHGFVVCLLYAIYPIIKQLKLWEKKWKAHFLPGAL